MIVVVVLLVAVALYALLWGVALLAQGYFYEQPAAGLAWRAAVGAGVMAAFVGIWCALYAQDRSTYTTVFAYSPTDTQPAYPALVTVRFRGPNLPETETAYTLRRLPTGGSEYRDANGRPWRRSDNGMVTAIKLTEADGSLTTFVPSDDSVRDGLFQTDNVLFLEVGGDRTMTEYELGRPSREVPGRFGANLTVNLLHLVLWFTVFWPLLRFTWGHALTLAGALWLLMKSVRTTPSASVTSQPWAERMKIG